MGKWEADDLCGPWLQIDPLRVSYESTIVVKKVTEAICDQMRDVVVPYYTGGRASKEWSDSALRPL